MDLCSVLWPQVVGLYKRRKDNTTDTALDFALPTTNATSGLQQAQVTAMQDEIHVLKKQLYEVSPFANHLLRCPIFMHGIEMHVSGT